MPCLFLYIQFVGSVLDWYVLAHARHCLRYNFLDTLALCIEAVEVNFLLCFKKLNCSKNEILAHWMIVCGWVRMLYDNYTSPSTPTSWSLCDLCLYISANPTWNCIMFMLGLQATSLALTIGLPRLHYLAAADLIDKNWSQMLLLYQRYVVCVCVHILFLH
jgi:hypothetical protein